MIFLLLGMGAVSCAGTYRPATYQVPAIPAGSPYAVLSGIQVTAKDGVSNRELNDFDIAIRRAVESRGVQIDPLADKPLLNVQLHRLNAESPAWHAAKVVLGITIPGSSNNAIRVQLETWQHGRRLHHFTEFDSYQEKTPDWEAMKTAVSNRIADAIYYAR